MRLPFTQKKTAPDQPTEQTMNATKTPLQTTRAPTITPPKAGSEPAFNMPVLASEGLLNADTLTRHCAALSTPELVGLAHQCRALQMQILRRVGVLALLSEAIEQAAGEGIQPVEWLKNRLRKLTAAQQKAELAKVLVNRRKEARGERLMALDIAVGHRSSGLAAERSELMQRMPLLRKQQDFDGAYQKWIKAGLTHEQIKAIGGPENPEEKAQRKLEEYQLRLPVVNSELERLCAYTADPARNPVHLEGLGFDDLIEAARMLDETEAPR
jgi:hypothetical protein